MAAGYSDHACIKAGRTPVADSAYASGGATTGIIGIESCDRLTVT
jgi:hypothetical protein